MPTPIHMKKATSGEAQECQASFYHLYHLLLKCSTINVFIQGLNSIHDIVFVCHTFLSEYGPQKSLLPLSADSVSPFWNLASSDTPHSPPPPHPSLLLISCIPTKNWKLPHERILSRPHILPKWNPFPFLTRKLQWEIKGLFGNVLKTVLQKQFLIVFRNKILIGNSNTKNCSLGLFFIKALYTCVQCKSFQNIIHFFNVSLNTFLKKKKKKPAFGTIFQKTVFYSKFVKPCFLS